LHTKNILKSLKKFLAEKAKFNKNKRSTHFQRKILHATPKWTKITVIKRLAAAPS
jgi:hypothetical protein